MYEYQLCQALIIGYEDMTLLSVSKQNRSKRLLRIAGPTPQELVWL
jgi:hypothetical protein